MKQKILLWLIEKLLNSLSPELVRKATDRLLDFIEDAVADSETVIDDKLVLPICSMIREAFSLPDED